MNALHLLAAASAALAVALVVPPRARLPPPAAPTLAAPVVEVGWLRRHRAVWSLLAAAAGGTFVGGPAGLVAAAGAGLGVWVVIGRAETPAARRARADVRRDLPAVVALLGAALRSGAAPADAVVLVARALPGAAADRLGPVVARLALGVPAATVWTDLAADPDLAPLGRTMARAHDTGSAVVPAVERLADDLARRARATVEDRARAVGVKAAVPLGLCLLPAFVLIGIVPLVAGLLGSIAW
ncbi:type II secretion system F family protein [Nocardioides rubriscoriae]|uniref:type II secretion system F family protein n=1 Tax=Nocardioides rubriscoriae TaxID=642762 RepID=UPI0011E06D96|nr:type II secretion system F family protein [Nocardioides rubriscoriae]